MEQIEPIISKIENDASIKAAVLISGKADNFIAGADITMLEKAKTAAELTEVSHNGQKLMNRMAASKKPIVAAINGSCLGGGLEVALACSYRIATSSPKTKLGLPEVMLGLLPGAGGTQRLPQLVGIQEAIKMMTTGAQIKADKARKIGLVNEVVDPSALKNVALQAANELAAGSLKATPRKGGLMEILLEKNPLGRNVLFSQAAKQIEKAAGGKYPAPPAILECIREGVESGFEAGSKKERELFGSLGMTDVSKALRGIFFAQTATKRNPSGKVATPVGTVGILGAGLMGAGVAQVTASAGLNVVLKDRDASGLARGEAQIADALNARVKKRKMTPFDRDVQLSRVIGVSDADASWQKHISRCDLVIEAVFEDLGLKHKVINSIEPLLPKHAVFATNTSALPIANIAKAAARPERVIGMHYFSPVDKMPLLEIIPHAGTSPEAIGMAFDVGLKQGKTVIVVKDVPGFYVNRCLGPWAAEALYLVQQGVDAERLDKAVRKFGYPVGPVTLADEVGIDVLYHTYATLKGALGPRMGGASDGWLKDMVDAKMLGRKTGKGFYLYEKTPTKGKQGSGKTLNPEASELVKKHSAAAGGAKEAGLETAKDEELVERMVLRFMKETMHALEDGIIKNPQDGDIGAVFGLGFPPFLGGPFRYADTLKAGVVEAKMGRLADKLGERFAPPQILKDYAKAGKSFHASS
jgi:enoyl-CoA hydratase / long-chain 3-hydroxyacyl-CoA dehydrogenase